MLNIEEIEEPFLVGVFKNAKESVFSSEIFYNS